MIDQSLNWVLESRDAEKLELQSYLLSRPEAVVPVKAITADLGWTKYRLSEVISELQEDITTLFRVDNPGFSVDEKLKALVVDHDALIDRKELLFQYLNRSIAWIFLGELFSGRMDTYESFSERNATSIAVIRKARDKVLPVLESAGITLSKHNQLVGDERAIRIFFFGLMRQAYGNREIPFEPEVQEMIDTAINKLSNLFHWTLKETDKQALRMQFAIWYFRISAGNFVRLSPAETLFVPANEWDKTGKALLRGLEGIMREYVSAHALEYEREARFAVASIYSAGIIEGVPNANLTPETQKKLLHLRNMYEETFQKMFGEPLSANISEAIHQDLFASHLRVLFFSTKGFRPAPDLSRAESDFNLQTAFVRDVLRQIAAELKVSNDEIIHSLFAEYLNTTVARISPSLMLPEVVVTLDMTNLPGLESLLMRRMTAMPHVNVRVTRILEEQTDVYISDVEIASFGRIPGFIWYQYPTDYEFDRFEHQLVDITLRKANVVDDL
jgi:hypothetical protein